MSTSIFHQNVQISKSPTRLVSLDTTPYARDRSVTSRSVAWIRVTQLVPPSGELHVTAETCNVKRLVRQEKLNTNVRIPCYLSGKQKQGLFWGWDQLFCTRAQVRGKYRGEFECLHWRCSQNNLGTFTLCMTRIRKTDPCEFKIAVIAVVFHWAHTSHRLAVMQLDSCGLILWKLEEFKAKVPSVILVWKELLSPYCHAGCGTGAYVMRSPPFELLSTQLHEENIELIVGVLSTSSDTRTHDYYSPSKGALQNIVFLWSACHM